MNLFNKVQVLTPNLDLFERTERKLIVGQHDDNANLIPNATHIHRTTMFHFICFWLNFFFFFFFWGGGAEGVASLMQNVNV
jgi:hypothetical protein